ncbi:MAG: 50S ribosomal protein L21 [Chloroflexota bacterium]|nr:50S ribosomal protein L21 [Chloroflexota bacterium]
MYAIVTTGGKQYRVLEGQVIDVEQLPGDEGDTVDLNDVLLVADGENVTVGQPGVAGAKVKASILNHGRGRKVIVFKYKSKVRYRRKRGHRQSYTRLKIDEIVLN